MMRQAAAAAFIALLLAACGREPQDPGDSGVVRKCRIMADQAISQGIKLTPEQRRSSIAECQQALDEQTTRQHREQRARSVIGLRLHERWDSNILARVVKVDPVDPYRATVEVVKSWKGPFSTGQVLHAQSGSLAEGTVECVMGYEFSAEEQELVIFTNATTDPIIVYRCWVWPAAESQELMATLDRAVNPEQVQRPAALGGNGTITIRPGETLRVQFVQSANRVVPTALLPEVAPGTPAVLVLTLRQDPPGRTTLTVQNPFRRSLLRYQAAIPVPGESGVSLPTSTCPVLPGRIGTESWPYKIEELTLTDLKSMVQGDILMCKLKHGHPTLVGHAGETLPIPGR